MFIRIRIGLGIAVAEVNLVLAPFFTAKISNKMEDPDSSKDNYFF